MKKIILSLIFTTFVLLTAKTAFAAGNCQPIYGGGQTCVQTGNVAINKMVVNPKTGGLVDNLGINDEKFGPESIVTFQIAVTNTGNTQIGTIQVKDIFPPQFVDFAAGAGNFDTNARTLSFDVNNLNASETRTFNIVGKVVRADQLPGDRSIMCVVNQAIATSNGQVSQDSVQLCIQKDLQVQVVPGTTTVITGGETKGGLKVFPPQKVFTAPATGPEALPLMALIPTGLLGAFLRKKALIK